MKIFNSYLIIALMIFAASGRAFSQTSLIGGGGGLTYIIASSDYTDDIDTTGTKFGFDSNYHIMLKAKFGVAEQPLRFNVSLSYTSLNGSRDNVVLPSLQAADLETSMSIYSLAAGAEYHFIPASPVSPYATAELQLNSVGDRTFSRKQNERTVERSVNGGTRLGFGFGGGLDIAVGPKLNVDGGLRFGMPNLFGRDNGEKFLSTFNITLLLLYRAF